MAFCEGCGNDAAYRLRRYESGSWACDRCEHLPPIALADTYWGNGNGAACPALVDSSGKPVEFLSKGHKARWMKENKKQEAGDLFGGSRYSVANALPIAKPSYEQARRAAHEAVQKAKAQLKYRK